MALPPLTLKQRVDYLAHLWKALSQQHHRELRPLLRELVPDDGVVFDIGAHAGQFAKLFASLAPRGQVYAFEPAGYARNILERVVRLRGLGNVTPVAVALSDTGGETEILTPIKQSGGFGFGLAHLGDEADRAERRHWRERVPTLPMDNFARHFELSRLDFIKLDVEGWEMRVLTGGRETIARFRPAIMVEVVEEHLARAGNSPGEIWSLLAPLGYGAKALGEPEPRPVDAFSGNTDYLFLPDA